MKIGSSVLTAAAVVCAFTFTQGCVTTESQGSGRGAGAKHRGPFRHEHQGNETRSEGSSVAVNPYAAYEDPGSAVYEEPIITESTSYVEPNPVMAPVDQTEVYIVQKGDILSLLAADYDITTAALVELNNLSNPDVLYVGQELRVPTGRGTTQSPSKSTTTSPAVKRGGSYTIQKGDTLSGIAVAAGVSTSDLRDLNGIEGDKIMAGEELSIPAYGKVPAQGHTSRPSTTTRSTEPVEPASASSAPAPEPAAPVFGTAAPVASSDTIIVVDDVMYPGDTLDIKAAQYGVTKAEIMRLNGITDESQVREGQTIRIPVAE
ncbi:MAG: LysM peptidoglycan-binding domain-containing protein [Pontiella sp.]